MRESSLEILPSQRSNEIELSHLRGGDGCHAVRFASQFVDAMKSGVRSGQIQPPVQLIFDEIKIKCGVAYNASTGKETGFTASKNQNSMNFAAEILAMVVDANPVGSDNSEEKNDGGNENEDEAEGNNCPDPSGADDEGSSLPNLFVPRMAAATDANVWRFQTGVNQT